MQTEIRANGNLQIRLTPETQIQKLAVEEILKAAANGQTIKVWGDPGSGVSPVLVIEK